MEQGKAGLVGQSGEVLGRVVHGIEDRRRHR